MKHEEKVEIVREGTIKGLSTKEIAKQLGESESQVRMIRLRYNIKRRCKICGKEISGRKLLYCDECGKKHRLEMQKNRSQKKTYEKICPICGLTFSTKNPQKKYCSPDCSSLAHEIYYKNHWLPQYKRILIGWVGSAPV